MGNGVLELRQGLDISGRLKFLGLEIRIKLYVGPNSFEGEGLMKHLNVETSAGVPIISIGEKMEGGNAVGDARFYVLADFSSIALKVDVAGALSIPLLQAYAITNITINDDLFYFYS